MIKTVIVLTQLLWLPYMSRAQKTVSGKLDQILTILTQRSTQAKNAGYKIISIIANSDWSPKLEIFPTGDSLYIEGYAILDSKIGFMDGDGLKLYKKHIYVGKKEQPTDSLLLETSTFKEFKLEPDSDGFYWKLSLHKRQYPRQSGISEIINLVIRLSVIPVGVKDEGIGKSPSDLWCYGLIVFSKP